MGFVWKHLQPEQLRFIELGWRRVSAYLPGVLARWIPKLLLF